MIIRIDPSGPPPYAQIQDQLAVMIRSGVLAPGMRLPAIRHLANDLGLAVNTVARAYRGLEDDGLVTADGRRGTSVLDLAERPAADPADLGELKRRRRRCRRCSQRAMYMWSPTSVTPPIDWRSKPTTEGSGSTLRSTSCEPRSVGSRWRTADKSTGWTVARFILVSRMILFAM